MSKTYTTTFQIAWSSIRPIQTCATSSLKDDFYSPHSRNFSSALEKYLCCGGEILDIYKIIFTKFVNLEKNAYLCNIKCQQYGH
jgi:hypothetical protein